LAALARFFPALALRAGARFLRTNMLSRFDARARTPADKFALNPARSGLVAG
jgi:hypothetical protein